MLERVVCIFRALLLNENIEDLNLISIKVELLLYIYHSQGRKEGRKEGRKVGRKEGRKVGRKEGRKVGGK